MRVRTPESGRRSGIRVAAQRWTARSVPSAWLVVGLALATVGALTAALVGGRLAAHDATADASSVREPAPPLPELAVEGPPGSAAHAQLLVRVRAEAFADCVFRASLGAEQTASRAQGTAAPPYGACDAARPIGLDPSDVSRRGAHGPIDGRGARRGLGIFTLHGQREAWLLQYDAAGRGWGYSFDADGTARVQCRTVKGRLCWFAEQDPAGALFLGDRATELALAAVLRAGRGTG